jgi:hypothetical protein
MLKDVVGQPVMLGVPEKRPSKSSGPRPKVGDLGQTILTIEVVEWRIESTGEETRAQETADELKEYQWKRELEWGSQEFETSVCKGRCTAPPGTYIWS